VGGQCQQGDDVTTHRLLPPALVLVGTVLAILAILAIWVSRQVLESDQWTETSSKLLEEPAVQTAVAGYLVDQLYDNVDVAGEVRAALPERAAPLAAPAAAALRRGAEEVALRALDRPRVQQAWEEANRRTHELFVNWLEGGGDVVSTEQGVVTLDLKALLDEIAQRTGVGARVAARIPADAATIELVRPEQLGTVQTVGRALKPLAAVLVILMLACFGGAIALAGGHRRETLRACGFGLVFAGVAALVARELIGDVVVGDLATTAAVEPAVDASWKVGTSLLVGVATATIAYGVVVVAGTWLAGPTRAAVTARKAIAPYLRDPRIAYGVVAAVVLLVLLWGPTEATQRVLPALVLIALLVAGVEALRRQVRAEFPEPALPEPIEPGEPMEAEVASPQPAGASASPAAADGEPRTAPIGDTAVSQLERLTELHRAGDLDDDEFAVAKKHVLTSA
jgi:hypothetical protein